MQFARIKNHSELLRIGGPRKVEEKILEFVQSLKGRGIRAKTIGLHLTALWHFYTFNNVTQINWTVLRKYLPEHQRAIKDRAYTVEEIRAVMKEADVRMRFVIALLSSTGMRIGAVPALTVGDFERVGNLCKFTVYSRTPGEYITFGTPECLMLGEQYLEHRKRHGEVLTQQSPLVRNKFDVENRAAAMEPQPSSYNSLMSVIRELLMDAGVRQSGSHDKRKRHEVMLNHGFRKFYNTKMIDSSVNPVVKEMLIGHRTIGLESAYYRPDIATLLKEYSKAIEALTIVSTSRIEQELRDTKRELATKSALEVTVAAQKQVIEKLQDTLDGIMTGRIKLPRRLPPLTGEFGKPEQVEDSDADDSESAN
jgi:integrase